MTATRPVPPAHAVFLGYCVKRAGHPDGVIFVSVDVGADLSSLHDVVLTGLANGDLLQYDNTTPAWKNVASIGAAQVKGTTPGAIQFTGPAPGLAITEDATKIRLDPTNGYLYLQQPTAGGTVLVMEAEGGGSAAKRNTWKQGATATYAGYAELFLETCAAMNITSTHPLAAAGNGFRLLPYLDVCYLQNRLSKGFWIGGNNGALATVVQLHATNTLIDGYLAVPKTSGYGIKVDTAAPTFPWRDKEGQLQVRAGANDPEWRQFRGTNYQYRFTNGLMREVWINFHIPHDLVPNSDMHLHVHWGQNVIDTGGPAGVPGNIEWNADLSYADGTVTGGGVADPFTAPITATWTQQGSTTQYGHLIAETQITSNGGSATTIDRNTITVDGILSVRLWTDSTRPAHTLNEHPFVMMADLHYQSTNVGTKQKAAPFYT